MLRRFERGKRRRNGKGKRRGVERGERQSGRRSVGLAWGGATGVGGTDGVQEEGELMERSNEFLAHSSTRLKILSSNRAVRSKVAALSTDQAKVV